MEINVGTYLANIFSGKRIAILGFGREGRSTLSLIHKYLPKLELRVVDQNPEAATNLASGNSQRSSVDFFTGDNYIEGLNGVDTIIKSPGISYKLLDKAGIKIPVISQTSIFLSLYRQQVIGVTGTKGKSTTVSLMYEIIKQTGKKVLLGGNIGVPPFDLIKDMDGNTIVVYEMSSHQLEGVNVSPNIAVLLNIFQEHLDHYNSYFDYQMAKFNIANWQNQDNTLIYTPNNEQIGNLLKRYPPKSTLFAIGELSPSGNGVLFENNDLIIHHNGSTRRIEGIKQISNLTGNHNLINLAAAAAASYLVGAENEQIAKGIGNFKGLSHRLERVGNINGSIFYNDSISTIPEAAIEALKSLPHTGTLMLGGFDRGVNYSLLCDWLWKNPVKNIIFIGNAGQRIMNEYKSGTISAEQSLFMCHDFETAVNLAIKHTKPGEVCLLSPAAASYDMFENFEERGKKFKQLIQSAEGYTAC